MLRKISKVPHYAKGAAKQIIEDGLAFFYGMPGSPLHTLGIRPLYHLNRLQKLVTDNRVNHAYLVKGRAVGSGLPLCVAFAGSWSFGQLNTLPLYEHLLFEEGSTSRTLLGSFPFSDLRRRAEELASEANLVAVMRNNLLAWQPAFGEWVVGPAGIRMAFRYHPGEDWAAVERRMKGHEHNISLVRRGKFTCSTCRAEDPGSEADFSFFYHRLYLPLVKSRYHEYGAVVHEPGIYEVFKKRGMLLLIRDAQGEIVSGGLQYLRRGVMYALINGVRDGDKSLVKKGALAACHYYAIQWGHQNHLRLFDVGVGLPYTNNGVYQHKRFWGYEPLPNLWDPTEVLLWAPEPRADVLHWMESNLFLPQFARWGGSHLERVYGGNGTAAA